MSNRKVIIFIAMSLDGYIATKDDKLDWLFQVEGEGDNGYSQFFSTIDTIIMGRRTYDWLIEEVKGEFPYKNQSCYVISHSMKETDDATVFSGDVVDLVQQLKNEQAQNIWLVGGGELIHTFLKNGLVDELIVTVAPIILGEGIPLFKQLEQQMNLLLKGTRRFNQFVELHYEVKH